MDRHNISAQNSLILTKPRKLPTRNRAIRNKPSMPKHISQPAVPAYQNPKACVAHNTICIVRPSNRRVTFFLGRGSAASKRPRPFLGRGSAAFWRPRPNGPKVEAVSETVNIVKFQSNSLTTAKTRPSSSWTHV